MSDYQATIYDDVWRTMINDFPELLISFVNELFATSYDKDARVVLLQDTHEQNSQDGEAEKRITDSCFKIVTIDGAVKHFHVECQSTADDSMLVRMFEYGAQIALDAAEVKTGKISVDFPHAGILFLRSRKRTPDKMVISINTPGGSVSYDVKVAKMQSYTLEQIFYKELLLLLPFYMFIVEKSFPACEKDSARLQELRESLIGIVRQLEILTVAGIISEYTRKSIMELSNKVNMQLTQKYTAIQKEAESIMGGKVLEYEAKTIYKSGIECGFERGIERGIEQGTLKTLYNLVKDELITNVEAAKRAGMSLEEFTKAVAML